MGWNRQILRQPPNMGTQKWVAWHLTLKKISWWSGLVMIDGWWWLTFLRRNQWRKTGVGTVFFGHFFQIQGPTNEVIFLSSKPPYFTEPNSDPCPISPAVGFCCSFWQSDFGQPDIGGWSAVHVGEMADQQENEGLFIIHHWLRHGIIIKRYSTSVLWTYPKYLLILIPMKLWLGRGPWHVDQFAFQSDQQNLER